MTDQSKRSFILSLKRLKFFFNNLKDYDPSQDLRANVQSVSMDELNEKEHPVSQWQEEATKAIIESKRFIDLIESQEKYFKYFKKNYSGKYEKLMMDKEQMISMQNQEIQELEESIEKVKREIEAKKRQELDIRKQIERENKQNQKEIEVKQSEINQVVKEKNDYDKLLSDKISELEEEEDYARLHFHKVKQKLTKTEENNKFLYFFPQKVYNQKQRILGKKEELQLYKSIIEESLSFLEQKIIQNKEKHSLVQSMNDDTSRIIDHTLQMEQQFYESDTQDKLKTPPFSYVKRLER